MISQMITLNILLVPVISVYFINRKGIEKGKITLHTLVYYVLSVSANVILCKSITAFLRFFGIDILLDSGYYTIISVVVAVFLSVAYRALKKCVKLNVEVCFNESKKQ